MQLFTQELPSPRRVQETPPPGSIQDTLIARGLQKEQYVGIIGVAIPSLRDATRTVSSDNAPVATVGFFSCRFEYALMFAIALSAILIAVFLLV
ncbi:hypothetical protein NIES2111_22380 [Nostoc sp. NIES-2111]|nr:hypothetical protein NIES2111_22380 [Nostoc sp. NIES-2111]